MQDFLLGLPLARADMTSQSGPLFLLYLLFSLWFLPLHLFRSALSIAVRSFVPPVTPVPLVVLSLPVSSLLQTSPSQTPQGGTRSP